MALIGHAPSVEPGGIGELALSMAAGVARAAFTSQMYNARLGTLQHVPAPICHTDLIPPVPNPTQPVIPIAGDPGAYATVAALAEDR